MWCCALHSPSSRTCATPHPSLLGLKLAHFGLSDQTLAQVLVREARQKFYGQLQQNEALAAGNHGGQRWLDDSWATHAMAGLVLVSPLGVWGALAAAHALLQLTGHFAFNGRGLL